MTTPSPYPDHTGQPQADGPPVVPTPVGQNPQNPAWGLSPAEAGSDQIEIDEGPSEVVPKFWAILIGFLGLAIAGASYLVWAQLQNLGVWSQELTALMGKPVTEQELRDDIGFTTVNANGQFDEFTGRWVLYAGIALAILAGALFQRRASAAMALGAAALSAVIVVLGVVSYFKVASLDSEIQEFINDPTEGLPAINPDLDVITLTHGIGLYLVIGLGVVAIAAAIAAYLQRIPAEPAHDLPQPPFAAGPGGVTY